MLLNTSYQTPANEGSRVVEALVFRSKAPEVFADSYRNMNVLLRVSQFPASGLAGFGIYSKILARRSDFLSSNDRDAFHGVVNFPHPPRSMVFMLLAVVLQVQLMLPINEAGIKRQKGRELRDHPRQGYVGNACVVVTTSNLCREQPY